MQRLSIRVCVSLAPRGDAVSRLSLGPVSRRTAWDAEVGGGSSWGLGVQGGSSLPEGGGLRCLGDARGSPGRDRDPSRSAGPCHRPSCFDTGVSWNLSDIAEVEKAGPRSQLAVSQTPRSSRLRRTSFFSFPLAAAFQSRSHTSCCLTSPCFRLHSKKKSCPAILSLVLAERPRQPSPPPTRACPTRAASRGPRASMGAGDPDGQLDGWPCSLEGRSCRAPAQLGGP